MSGWYFFSFCLRGNILQALIFAVQVLTVEKSLADIYQNKNGENDRKEESVLRFPVLVRRKKGERYQNLSAPHKGERHLFSSLSLKSSNR